MTLITTNILSGVLILFKVLVIFLVLYPSILENDCKSVESCKVISLHIAATVGIGLSSISNVLWIFKLFCGYFCVLILYMGLLYIPTGWLTYILIKREMNSEDIRITIWIISLMIIDTLFNVLICFNRVGDKIRWDKSKEQIGMDLKT